MKLSRLYSNQPDVFLPISFRPGLNVILAEIRDPKNRDVDTHNLGKTTLAALIDFCLLKGRSSSFFLFRNQERFERLVFFLEVRTNHGELVTIRRSVERATKISFKRHAEPEPDLSDLAPQQWDHWEVPFDRAKKILDGVLALDAASPWGFRQPLGYCLRLQKDYADVFQLDKYRGRHREWKPFLAHMIGLDGQAVEKGYELAEQIAEKEREERSLAAELSGVSEEPDKLEGIILVRKQEIERLETTLSTYDFAVPEEEYNKALVDQIERETAELNERRYYLSMHKQRIDESLDDPVKFDLTHINQVFEEAGIYFPDALNRDYQALLRFLEAVSTEREAYLREELEQTAAELTTISGKLAALSAERSRALAVLREVETFEKYKKLSQKLVELKATVEILTRQKESLRRLSALRRALRELHQKRDDNRDRLEENLQSKPDRYRSIRLFFAEIVAAVLDRNAVLSTRINQEGNLEFSAEILDQTGSSTSQDDGHTYKKLLCVAFDMAVLRSYIEDPYVRFVYHDGVFESLDDRKKLNLLEQMREYARLGIQQVITLIDSDLPRDSSGRPVEFSSGEVVRVLHDEGVEGRLFRMEEW